MIFADATAAIRGRTSFTAFDDAIRFVLAAKAAGIPIAAASCSKNADLLLRRAELVAEVSRPTLAEGRLERKTLDRKVEA
jgi:hypothetical protein